MTLHADLPADEEAKHPADFFPRNVQDHFPMPEGTTRVTLLDAGRYVAYAYDLDFMWRWVITRDGEEVQDGPALSQESARECVTRVMAFFSRRDGNLSGGAYPTANTR